MAGVRTYKITCDECGYSKVVSSAQLTYEEGKTCPKCRKGKMYWVPPAEEARRREFWGRNRQGGRTMPEEERRISPALVIVGGLGLGIAAVMGIAAMAMAAPPPEEYICPHCGAAFATYEELAYHIQTQHPGAYVCLYCGATFNTYEELVAHVQGEHPGERIPIDIIWE